MKITRILLLVLLTASSAVWAAGTWTVQNSGVFMSLRSIACPSTSACYAVGDSGALLRMSPDGNSWVLHRLIASSTSTSLDTLVSISFMDSMRGYIASSGLAVHRTLNKGIGWDPVSISQTLKWTAVQAIEGQVYVVGASQSCSKAGCFIYPNIMKSEVSQSSWSYAESIMDLGQNISAGFHFVNATTGYVLGVGTVYKTINGGGSASSSGSWSKKVVAEVPLRAIHFVGTGPGYVVGDMGEIYKTTDGGVHWNFQLSGTTKSLRAVKFIDANIGYAVGDVGTILVTTNGGNDWTSMPSPTTVHLRALAFLGNGSIGYAVGEGGTILKLTGGTPTSIAPPRRLNPAAGIRRIGNRWYGFSMPDGRAFDAQGREAPAAPK